MAILALATLLPLRTHANPPPPPVLFSKQVLPLLRAQCWGCHSGPNAASGFSLETREKMLAGGRHGATILVGKGKNSALVRYLTGELKPIMPPNGALDMQQIALIRRWIEEGAKVDSMNYAAPRSSAASVPPLAHEKAHQAAPVTALAFSPDGTMLAAGGYQRVRLYDPVDGMLRKTWTGATDQVQALAFSSDGKWLAACGGVPGEAGEVAIFEVQTGRIVRKLTGHTEVVYAVAWKTGSQELATGSLDKTARIWNAASGQCVHVIKDHAEAVFGVSYSPDGKLLATASGDRTAKLFDTASWKRMATLNAHQDGLTRVAFNRDGTLLATAGSDKQVRLWAVKIGGMENPTRTFGAGDIITDCAFAPDTNLLIYSSADRVVRAFNGDDGQHRRDLKEAEDWVYAVAIARSGRTVAAGTQDGKVCFWEPKDWKLLRAISVGKTPTVGKTETTK